MSAFAQHLKYLSGASVQECQEELWEIIRLFTRESQRYFDDILDYEAYGNLFCSVARVLVKEKKGLKEDSLSEGLQRKRWKKGRRIIC